MKVFFKRIFLAAAILIGMYGWAATASAIGLIWQTVGEPSHFSAYTVSLPSIKIDSNGRIYVAYSDGGDNYKVSVERYEGSSWDYVGAPTFSSPGVGPVSLALDATGTPYVAYLNSASSSRVSVMKYDGSSWIDVGNPNFSTSSIEEVQLAINPSGIPYVSFIDVGNNYAPTVMKLSGSTWVTVGAAYTDTTGGGLSMGFSTTGTPYVAFSDTATGWPTVLRFNGTSWDSLGTSTLQTISLAGDTQLGISPNNTLYLVTSNSGDVGAPLHILTFDGTDWNQIGSTVEIDNNTNYSIAFSATGTPYISLLSHLDSISVGTVIAYRGSDWAVVGTAQFTGAVYSGKLPLTVGPNGAPYVVFGDASDVALDEINYQLVTMGYLPTVSASVTGLSASYSSPHEVILSWTVPSHDGDAPITGYKIERSIGDGYVTLVSNTGSLNPTYTDTYASRGFNNTYRVSAVNSVGASEGVLVSLTLPALDSLVPAIPPTALGTGSALGFSINKGAKTTTNPIVTLDLNANPTTVRGYAVSLDPNFVGASLIPLTNTAQFTLPAAFGTYKVYLKYFSITGHASSVLSQTIEYQKNNVTTQSAPGVSVLSQEGEFKRQLQLGSTGGDVVALQRFLNAHGFFVAKTGAGSPGHETTRYGALTAAAVTQFQEANSATILKPAGLKKGTGVFGINTMRAVNSML